MSCEENMAVQYQTCSIWILQLIPGKNLPKLSSYVIEKLQTWNCLNMQLFSSQIIIEVFQNSKMSPV